MRFNDKPAATVSALSVLVRMLTPVGNAVVRFFRGVVSSFPRIVGLSVAVFFGWFTTDALMGDGLPVEVSRVTSAVILFLVFISMLMVLKGGREPVLGASTVSYAVAWVVFMSTTNHESVPNPAGHLIAQTVTLLGCLMVCQFVVFGKWVAPKLHAAYKSTKTEMMQEKAKATSFKQKV